MSVFALYRSGSVVCDGGLGDARYCRRSSCWSCWSWRGSPAGACCLEAGCSLSPVGSPGLTQSGRQIGVSFAPAIDDDVLLLRSFDHAEGLGRPSVTALEMSSTEAGIDPNSILGHPAVVRMDTPEGDRFIRGYVWSFESLGQEGGLWRYRAEVRPWLGMLEANREYRVFQQKTAADVVSALLGVHSGAMELRPNLFGSSYRTRDLCVQYGESDLAFVSRLLEDDGIYYTFEYTESGETLVLHDDSTQHEPRPGDASMPYQPEGAYGGGMTDPEAVTRFERSSGYRCARYGALDYSPVRPSTYVMGMRDGGLDHGPSWRQRYGYVESYGGPQTVDEAEAAARLRMEEGEASADVFRGQTPSRLLGPGMTISLRDHPGYEASDSFLVTGVAISAHGSPFESGVTGATDVSFECSFEAMRADRAFRPARVTPKPKAEMQTAVIAAAAEGDDTPDLAKDDYCCVRLRFHWDHFAASRHPIGDVDDMSDAGSSCWVRTSQSWAGKNFGWVSIPHPGQEVIVDFINGDPDRPIVVGRVYNEENRPMMTPAENKAKMQLRDSGQNHIVMGAESGQQVIEMYSPSSGTRIRIGGG
ncbi:MAG: type VI secretion system tip protein TssI/VgrG [Planctomycetota bacterium]